MYKFRKSTHAWFHSAFDETADTEWWVGGSGGGGEDQIMSRRIYATHILQKSQKCGETHMYKFP
jgi:hypothetical protein